MQKRIPVIIGTIAALAVIAIGGVFAYQYFVPQHKTGYQGYVKYENGACATHIVNASTNEDVILKEEKTEDPTSCDFCQIKSFSPDNQYTIEDCGTSPVRSLAIINRSTKKEVIVTSSSGYGWLNNQELVFTDASGQERNCIQGPQSGITKINVSTGIKTVLKQPDANHGYFVKEVSNGNISYLETTYSKSVYSNDCDFTSYSSDAIMDGNGKNQISAGDSKTADWKTYANDQYGFEIQYPATISFSEFPTGQASTREFTSTYQGSGLSGPLNIFVTQGPPDKTYWKPVSAATVGGVNGQKIRIFTASTDECYAVVIEKGGWTYSFDDNCQADTDIFNKMLSTFKFTK